MRIALLLLALAAAPPVADVRAAGSAEAVALQYRAPAEGSAPRRVGGSSRGVPPALPTVAALVPDHLGLTVSAQPTLYWYLSAATGARIELALIEPGIEQPLLEVALPGASAGMQRLDLRAHDVQLRIGVEYEWSVALVADGGNRSRDIVSGGAIMRISPPAGLIATAQGYAAHGLWYDALMAIERTTTPLGEPALRSQRATLLEQTGLAEIASFERRP